MSIIAAHTAMRKPAEVWVFPVHLRQGKQPADDTAEVLALVNMIARVRFSAHTERKDHDNSLMMPTIKREILFRHIEAMCADLKALDEEMGWAS